MLLNYNKSYINRSCLWRGIVSVLHNGTKFDLVIEGIPTKWWLLSPRGTWAPLELLWNNSDLRECVLVILFIWRFWINMDTYFKCEDVLYTLKRTEFSFSVYFHGHSFSDPLLISKLLWAWQLPQQVLHTPLTKCLFLCLSFSQHLEPTG